MATGGNEPSTTNAQEEYFDWICIKCHESDKVIEATSFCITCNEAFCEFCLKDHNRFLKKHTVLGDTEKRGWGKSTRQPTSELECSEHCGQIITLYCQRHDVVCCPMCALWKHSDECKPSMSPVSELAKKKKNQTRAVDNVIKETDSLLSDFQVFENELDQLQSASRSSRNRCITDVDDFAQTLLSHIEQLKQIAAVKVNKLHDDRDKELKLDKDKCAESIQALHEMKMKLQTTDRADAVTVFVRTKTSQTRLQELKHQSKNRWHQKEIRVSFKRNPVAAQLVNTLQNLGTYDESTNLQETVKDIPCEANSSVQAENEPCVICMDDIDDPKVLDCGHMFCTDCIDQSLAFKQVCPKCGKGCGVITGDQPKGTMTYTNTHSSLAGHDSYGTIKISCTFPNGQQETRHPTPGKWYKDIHRIAYLPDNRKGNIVFEMLKIAFDRKLLFTIGTSRTTGEEEVITWNDIHQKTNPTPHGKKGLAGEVQQTWEGGNMWPFSCLGFEKDSQSLPGFTDMSVEELRHEAYEARAQGTFNIYVEKVASLLREVASQKQELKNPSMNLKQRLISFIDDDRRKRQSSSQTSLFSDSSLFGPDNSSQQSTGLFGGQSSGFEQQSTSQSAFGQSGNQSLFGQTGSSSLFGQQSQTNQSGFGQSSSGFGQSSSGIGQSSTGFGQSSGGFGQNFTGMGLAGSGQTSVFGQPVQQSTNTPSTPKVSLFGKPAVFGTPGASPVASGTFSSQPSASNQNAFGTSQVVPSGSTFGSASANQTHTATVPSSSGESPVYTSMDKLTTEEVQQFTAATFTVGQIPTKPPPKELCF